MVEALKSLSLGEYLKESGVLGKELDVGWGRGTGAHTQSLEILEELSQEREFTLLFFSSAGERIGIYENIR